MEEAALSPLISQLRPSLARGRHDPFQLLEPVEDNCELRRRRLRLRLPNQNEAASVRRRCKIVEALEVRAFEKKVRLAGLKTRFGFDRYRHHLQALSISGVR